MKGSPPLMCGKRLNGLGSPFGFETLDVDVRCHTSGDRLNGLGSPFGFETKLVRLYRRYIVRLNGLGSPFGFETF